MRVPVEARSPLPGPQPQHSWREHGQHQSEPPAPVSPAPAPTWLGNECRRPRTLVPAMTRPVSAGP